MSNPIFDRIDREGRNGYAGFGQQPTQAPQAPNYGSYAGQEAMSQQSLEQMYNQPSASPTQMGRVTMDDVIMKTLGLFAIVVVVGGIAWNVVNPLSGQANLVVLGSIAITLVLGLIITFKKTISVPLIIAYAVFEGVLVGVVSRIYNDLFGGGIVGQAVLATLCVFGAMFLAYKTGLIKVTSKFRKIMTFAILGYALFAVINLGYALFTGTPFGIGGNSMLGVGISVFATGLAAFTLALDFDSIDKAIAQGAPAKYSWLLAHGLIVTLVWLYLEMLRLLGRLNSR